MRSELVIGKPKDRRAQLIQRVLNKPDKRRASPQPLNEPKLNFCHLYYQHKLSPGPRNSAFTSSNQSSRMQDLIFLNSAHFFENNCDVLAFKGTFASESGPHLRARPNASPLALYRLRADRQCLQDNKSYPIGLNLSLPYHGGFEVAAGRLYRLQGTIGKLDDETTTVLEIEQDGDNQEIADTELVELGPVTITGIGAIERATLLYSIPLELPVWELIVAHEGMRNSSAAVKVRYLLGVDSLDVPGNTVFGRLAYLPNWRIGLTGKQEWDDDCKCFLKDNSIAHE
ncbi:hypothetical protein MJO29_016647 [Puccinia striiformis f. sp. tritici]|nr:hypothetical protein MJO29_016647 [Puccinia striiformis f. sp. tritici]